MLRDLHKASSTWLGKTVMAVVFAILTVSFTIWGIGDIFHGFGAATLAKIGKTEIGIEQFRQIYNDRLQQLGRQLNRPISSDQARILGLDRQLLAQLIAESALDEQARALGLGIPASDVVRRITEDPAFRGVSGQFDPARFQQLIHQVGLTEQRFMNEQQRVALRRQLAGSIAGELSIPKTTAEALARLQNEQRTIEYVRLGPAQAGDIPPPSSETLAKYFEERKASFRAPEYRKLNILGLTPDAVARTIEISAGDIQKTYEANKDRYTIQEKRELQQIVFPNIDEARKASERIKGGLTFEALAQERGVSAKDMDLGLVVKSTIADPAVANTAFSLKENTVSEPINGRFGATLVRVVKIEPGRIRQLSEVEIDIKNQLALDRARDELSKLRDKIEDELAAGLRVDEIAQKLKLPFNNIAAVDRSGHGPDGQPITALPKEVDVISAAFASEVGIENDVLQVPGGGFVWYDVTEITPSRERSLDEVKDKVESRWRDDEIAMRLSAKANDMVSKIKGGSSLAALATAEKLKVETAKGIKRNSTPEGLSSNTVTEIFQTAKGEVGSEEGAQPAERIVFRVTDIIVPAFDPASAEGKRITEALRNALGDELLAQYVTQIENDLGVTINQTALNQAVGGTATH